MSSAKLLIAGAGGHGRVVADVALASGVWGQVEFLDDAHPRLESTGSWRVIGSLTSLDSQAGRYDAFFAAVGNARTRLEMLTRARAAGFDIPVIIHPRAWISPNARLGAGTLVNAGAIINVGSRLGEGCIVNTSASVDHDCELADGVHVCPGAHLAGGVALGLRTWFGIGAVARQGIRIGADVTVGAGAVCVHDVSDGLTVTGVPARSM